VKVYPRFLTGLDRRRCIVVGSDHEAERKIEGLLEVDADVTAIGPALSAALQPRVRWIDRDYRPGDLRGAFLVIASPSCARDHEAIHGEAEREGALINVMDDVAHCNCVAGSVLRRGPLTVSISTGGAAPVLAVRLRQRLELELGPEYSEFLELVEPFRDEIATRVPQFERRRELWYRLVDSDLLEHLRQGRRDEARKRLEALISPA